MYFVIASRPAYGTVAIDYCYRHPMDGRMQLSPTPEPIDTYEEAQAALSVTLEWWQDQAPGWTVMLIGNDAIMSEHSLMRRERLSLAKPAHPNLFTNA